MGTRLVDGRGRKKRESELTEIKKLKRDHELLLAKNTRLEMENVVLKELEEIERRDRSIKSSKKRNTKR